MKIGLMILVGVFCLMLTLLTFMFTLTIAWVVARDVRDHYTDVGSGIVGTLVCSMSFLIMLGVDWLWATWALAPITAYLN